MPPPRVGTQMRVWRLRGAWGGGVFAVSATQAVCQAEQRPADGPTLFHSDRVAPTTSPRLPAWRQGSRGSARARRSGAHPATSQSAIDDRGDALRCARAAIEEMAIEEMAERLAAFARSGRMHRRFFRTFVEQGRLRSVAPAWQPMHAMTDAAQPGGSPSIFSCTLRWREVSLSGLYELSQPVRRQNPGLAAYTPPPATVIRPGWSTNRAALHAADVIAPPVVAASIPEAETEGRSIPQPPITEALVPAHRPPKVAKTSNRHVRAEPVQQQQAACIPRYDSSGAQTHAC